MPVTPTETYEATGLQCPNPYCRIRVGPRRMLHGAHIDQCPACSTWYLARSVVGVADVNGLPPELGERYASADLTDTRLAMLLREAGIIRHRERAS